MGIFPRFKPKKTKNLKPVLLDEDKLAERVAIRANELQQKEMREKKQQKMLAIYSHLSPRQRRRLKYVAERKGVQNERK